MSLLNDALRKKSAEHIGLSSPVPQAGRHRQSGKRIGRGALIVLALLCVPATLAGTWVWGSHTQAPRLSMAVMDSPSPSGPNLTAAVVAEFGNQQTQAATRSTDHFSVADLPEPTAGRSLPAAPLKPSLPAAGAAKTTAALPPQPASGSQQLPPPLKTAAPTPSPRPSAHPQTTHPQINETVSRPHASADPLYQKATQYHRRRQWPQAIAMYRQVLAIDPDHFDARFFLTSAYLEKHEFAPAFDLAADLARQHPDDPRVLLHLAVSQIGCGRAEEAIRLLNRMVDHPAAPLYEVYFHQGIAHRLIDDVDGALAWYDKAARLQPDDPRLLFNMALARDQLRQFDAAVDGYRKYLQQAQDLDSVKKNEIEHRIRILQAASERPQQKE